MSQFFASGGQRIGVSASASVLPMNIQGCFPLGLIGLISLQSCPTPQFKSINYLVLSFLYDPTLTSIHQFSSVTQSCLTLCDPMNRSTPGLPVHHQPLYMTTGKTLVLTVWTFVSKVMSLPFGTLSMSTLSPYKISPPIFLDDLISSVTGSDLCEIFLL